MARSLDARDATKEPPAYLDPESVLRNRKRVRMYLIYGVWFNHLPEAMQCKS